MADPLSVQGIGGLQAGRVEPPQLQAAKPTAPTQSNSFADVLTETISEVQRLQTEADTTIKKLVSGEIKDVTETMVAVERADVAFQTMMTVRNKIVSAYEQIMSMQV
jgi:flagellar hook-basal body complex protein FliE